MKNRGLVVIYDPHALMQFLQFYCMGDYEAEWDVLCLPKENGKGEMCPYCEKAGIFHNVFEGEIEYQKLSTVRKLKIFFAMFIYALAGQQKKYCKRTLNQYVGNIDNYNILAANTESGFVSGMLASFGKEKTVVYFEDGMADYRFVRKRWKSNYKYNIFTDFQCVIMARLGYFGKGYTYLKTTKDTIKYCSIKKELLYQNYKEIREFSMNSNMLAEFRLIINRVYPELIKLRIDPEAAILFTDTNDSGFKDWDEYVKQFIQIICQSHKKLVLKCHPREDMSEYHFPLSISVEIIPKDIPAELLLPYLNGNACYFMIPNSILLNMRIYNLKANILYFKPMYEVEVPGIDLSKVKEICERFAKNQYNIIDISKIPQRDEVRSFL